MRPSHRHYWLHMAAAAAGVALMFGLIANALGGTQANSAWEAPALEFGVLLLPALLYTTIALLLLAFNFDLEPSAPAKGELTHLLGLKRRGALPARSRRASGLRSRRWRLQTGGHFVVESPSAPQSTLDRLVALKRFDT
jgi:hypothetical protein